MTEGVIPRESATLHPIANEFADALMRVAGSRIEITRNDSGTWLTIEEVSSAVTFVEVEGSELRIVPFQGDPVAQERSSALASFRPSWLDGQQEVVVDLARIESFSDRGLIIDLMHAALNYWSESDRLLGSDQSAGVESADEDAASIPEISAVDFSEPQAQEASAESSTLHPQPQEALMRADISHEWSWASSTAKIPQITDLTVSLAHPVEVARLAVTLTDADEVFGSTALEVGSLPAGIWTLASLHVPLSTKVMSQVDERRGAECRIRLEDARSGQVLARCSEEVDVQPHDLWLFQGDPHRAEQRERLSRRARELAERLDEDPQDPDGPRLQGELARILAALETRPQHFALPKCLLASFVRPNHPDVAVVAREAAEHLAAATGDSAFQAFQLADLGDVEDRVEATVSAICQAIKARNFSYSDPPPGWDYEGVGQRIRDHGEVARGGLATCMDSTVFTAAVLEHVGMYPVLVLVPGHIFVGYWRRDPSARPAWYPDKPLLGGRDRNPDEQAQELKLLANLVEGRYLGFIESTALAMGSNTSLAMVRDHALSTFWNNLERATVIDLYAARRASVSPLPTIHSRSDGVTEIIEYRPEGSHPVVEIVEPGKPQVRPRQLDGHPARYRTWKASLFSLNAKNDLLNLKSNAKVQPLVLPREGLGILEDTLNQDQSVALISGYDLPDVWRARGTVNALQLLASQDPEEKQELMRFLDERKVFIQRIGRDRRACTPATLDKELKSMAHVAKTAKEERGMNPLFLCLGLLRWPYKEGLFAEAPLILVPVTLSFTRGRREFSLSLDSSQRTTPNAALIEWLRREHGLSIPGLAEPLADRAGIDVEGVLAEVRNAVTQAELPFDVAAEARLSVLDLSSFRMWQDLNAHADVFIERPLVKHLVNTPTETFEDPAIAGLGDAAREDVMWEELEKLETPIPADSMQKRAVVWARQGRTFVLQGPPGTGKSQTITNMVAECLLSGLRVLFVAEKGTALSVVQRRLESIGLGPFSLNLHQEGSNAAEVRAQLKRSLTAEVNPDHLAMESARRQLRNAHFELTEYPRKLHRPNAAGLSAYAAHDALLVLQDGPVLPVPTTLVAHQPELVGDLNDLFQDLQRWTSAAHVRPNHPWRLAGPGKHDPFDVEVVAKAVKGLLKGVEWVTTRTGGLREALSEAAYPWQIEVLLAAANPALPGGTDLLAVLDPAWPRVAAENVAGCERAAESWAAKLHGFHHDVLNLDVHGMKTQLDSATASGFMGRKGRQAAALAPLAAVAPAGLRVDAATAGPILADLVAVKEAGEQIRLSIRSVPGLADTVPANPFMPHALDGSRARLAELLEATEILRRDDEVVRKAIDLAQQGQLVDAAAGLSEYLIAWRTLWDELAIEEADFEAWRANDTMTGALNRVADEWRRDADFDRLMSLQRWCTLVRKLEPLRSAGLEEARSDLLEGRLPADAAEEALARGVAQACLRERIGVEGLDRFDAVAHDQRVMAYSKAQAQVREQWLTDAPARMLSKRGGGGGSSTGGLARELEKTTRRLGTRPLLRKYGKAIQELTPLVLASPSSVVDLIEPGVMEFDVAIFDEASQITVPEAIGAIGRANAVIVVGDSKQMPPTRKVGGGGNGDDDDAPDEEEIVEDQESILSECELARVPTLSLIWHYRSQDEALIAFSNRAYYRGALSSFPTPTLLSSETGVEFRRVHGADGEDTAMYLRAGSKRVHLAGGVVAGSNTNPYEAAEIVDYVHQLVHATDTRPSLGIVTFNEQQRQLIEDLLHASEDPKIAEVMDPATMGRGEVLFVKALEQVQGDERDVIIFSVAFSKQANGKIPTNFGPLSNSGGERRLNVAVTRARRKNVVFCSFDPQELDVAGASYQGPKDLKEFLLFAKAAGAIGEQGTGGRAVVRDRHRDDIAAALESAGLHVRSDVGLSNFRLDLVLSRPEKPDLPLLPVLLDGESWQRRATVSDRDVLPVEVLENLMGWPAVARIWWPMWLQNRDEVINEIRIAVDRVADLLVGDSAPSGVLDPTQAVEDLQPDSTVSANLIPTDAASDDLNASGEQTPSLDPFSPLEAAPGYAMAPEPVELPDSEERHGSSESIATTASHPPTAMTSDHAAGLEAATAGVDRMATFVGANTSVIGSKEVLDRLPERAAVKLVRDQVLDVIEEEGPVQLARLARIVARRFGLNALRASRAEGIIRLVPRRQIKRSKRLGDFAWPVDLDPNTWAGFRVPGEGDPRTLDEIAPQEIANAMLYVLEENPHVPYVDDVLRGTAELFGIMRLGAHVRERLESVYRTLPS